MTATDEADDGGPDRVEEMPAVLRDDEDRKWLLVINKVTERIFQPSEFEDMRVGLAYGRFLISAFERASRILRSDLPDDRG